VLIRRCSILFIEPRDDLEVDVGALLSGKGVLGATIRWVALAPHLGKEVELSPAESAALRTIGPTLWLERNLLEQQCGQEVIASLLEKGLLLSHDSSDGARERDEVLRKHHWHPITAMTHMFTRWDAVVAETGDRFPSFEELVEAFGPPPPATIEMCAPEAAVALPAPAPGTMDAVLLKRYTGRNYDPDAYLPLDVAARLLHRTWGAQEERTMADDSIALKKTSPSGGSLHPLEAYVMVQRVEGVAPGLYHYHPTRHALEPMVPMEAGSTRALAFEMVARQEWFADAPMLVVMAARVARNFWKYRNHSKAYRALVLDAGHLSQTFYLLATEAGLPAFITAAVNEATIEQAFGLDPVSDAVVAVVGCGIPSGSRKVVEFRYGD
jgi:putative peptide maturation dehydrogenase